MNWNKRKQNWRRLVSMLALVCTLGISGALTSSIANAASFSAGERAQILAPIALYPDSLLSHILIASTYPLEVVQACRLQLAHPNWSVEQLMASPKALEWDPSVVALLAFPTVLDKLSSDLEWTQRLGDAFLDDEVQVMASIQSLRQQAYEADSFDDMAHMKVTRVQQQIIIEPVNPQIVYVPYYSTRVVYGHWHWAHYPPVYWRPHPHYYWGHHGHWRWNAGVSIHFNYFFTAFHWGHHSHHLVVTHHHRSHHYKHHRKIAVSKGAQRWQHKPHHRRGVGYKSRSVATRYGMHSKAHRAYGGKTAHRSVSVTQSTRSSSKAMASSGNRATASQPQARVHRVKPPKKPYGGKSHQMVRSQPSKAVNAKASQKKSYAATSTRQTKASRSQVHRQHQGKNRAQSHGKKHSQSARSKASAPKRSQRQVRP
ncbi:DUF3300 domain-containing protein [Ferrimonas aestuarii]|uniref:DUF3300 domain-containing protein n=1 Tax=Ferrimonas aestuarii TaxID=2569539 RepID=A0A4U1BER5_9GAMM|nr:DUF3300 domain-containing protein [Ferrimonas aestuarii]TKB49681.1 DUF3300 domain-containing protein [Ferrimonas aestuarii]